MRLIDDRSKLEWIIEWLMLADDTVLPGDDKKSVCKKGKLTVNVEKA